MVSGGMGSVWRAVSGRWWDVVFSLLRRFGRLDQFAALHAATFGGRFITPQHYAEARGISETEAAALLNAAVRRGLLRQALIYQGDDVPAPIIVDETDVDKVVPLRLYGFPEEGTRKVRISRFSCMAVYVAGGH
jgi:hypothetical protein